MVMVAVVMVLDEGASGCGAVVEEGKEYKCLLFANNL